MNQSTRALLGLFILGAFFGIADEATASVPVPQIKLESTINVAGPHLIGGLGLGFSSSVKNLAFSPDGHYLAILSNPNLGSGTLIIWDLEKKREQTRIEGLSSLYGNAPGCRILWEPNGKYITFNGSVEKDRTTFWDPMTGKVFEQTDFQIYLAAFNRDGTQLVTKLKSGVRVYDTKTWDSKDFELFGIRIKTAFWTSDNKVIVTGDWTGGGIAYGTPPVTKIDDITPKLYDAVLCLIDPLGGEGSRSEILAPSIPSTVNNLPYESAFDLSFYAQDPTSNRIAIGEGAFKIINASTLEILADYKTTRDEVMSGSTPIGPYQFSADGKYIFMMGTNPNGQARSFIFDAQTATPIGSFPGGFMAFSVSPDGKFLATGNVWTVKIYSIQ